MQHILVRFIKKKIYNFIKTYDENFLLYMRIKQSRYNIITICRISLNYHLFFSIKIKTIILNIISFHLFPTNLNTVDIITIQPVR